MILHPRPESHRNLSFIRQDSGRAHSDPDSALSVRNPIQAEKMPYPGRAVHLGCGSSRPSGRGPGRRRGGTL